MAVVKSGADQKSKVVKEGDGANNSVTCFNKFAILADIEENETLNEISPNNEQRGKNARKNKQTTACTIPLTQSENIVNTLTDGYQEVSTEKLVGEHTNVQA